MDDIIQRAIEDQIEQKNTKSVRHTLNDNMNSSIFMKTNGYSRSID